MSKGQVAHIDCAKAYKPLEILGAMNKRLKPFPFPFGMLKKSVMIFTRVSLPFQDLMNTRY